jgi:ubiquinone/menaquinone biosynthesis C-methylase UbiE
VGCGDSRISEKMYDDLGYTNITNIDFEGDIIKVMQERSEKKRPGMIYKKMDATKTDFEDNSFDVILDKGRKEK